MLKIKIICLGKFKERAFVDLEKEYLKRVSPFAKVKIVELPDVSYKTLAQMEKAKLKEAQAIKKQLPDSGIVILMKENGQIRNSKDFATFVERLGGIGTELIFVIGSGAGLHDSLKEYANYEMSLSPLTFTHNFARVLLEEQLYRAITINTSKEYHK